MPIKYPVAPGTIVLCNYDTGFQSPEMVKRRPVIVISKQLEYRKELCTVIPLSTTAPRADVPYVHKIIFDKPLSTNFPETERWAKIDMLGTVSYKRLDLFRTARDHTGRRRYYMPKITSEDFDAIKAGIAYVCGIRIST